MFRMRAKFQALRVFEDYQNNGENGVLSTNEFGEPATAEELRFQDGACHAYSS